MAGNAMRASPCSQPPSGRQASSSSGPAARWIAPSTPPPPSRLELAALTIASAPASVVMSPWCSVMRPTTWTVRRGGGTPHERRPAAPGLLPLGRRLQVVLQLRGARDAHAEGRTVGARGLLLAFGGARLLRGRLAVGDLGHRGHALAEGRALRALHVLLALALAVVAVSLRLGGQAGLRAGCVGLGRVCLRGLLVRGPLIGW